MPIPHSAVHRSAAALVLLVGLTGCSVGGSEQSADTPSGAATSPSVSAASSGATEGGASAGTEEETCARVVEAVRTAPQQLREDPLALLEELTALADTAPADLRTQINETRDSITAFRQGDRRLTEVVGDVRDLQQRCSG